MGINLKSVLDNKTLFFYIMIIIGIIFAFSKIDIKLNIVFGTGIALAIIYYLYMNYREKQEQENKILSFQKDYVLPHIIDGYDDITKFLFSIQDFYVHNPQSYIEMVNNINNFFRVYEETIVNKRNSGTNYELMNDYKRASMNSLHSIIYNFPNNREYTNKLNNSIQILSTMLDVYLNKVLDYQKEHLHEFGYDVTTKIINDSDVLSYNSFDCDNHNITYQLF